VPSAYFRSVDLGIGSRSRATANRPRTAANSLEKLKRHFGTWFAEPLSTITAERIELWKIRRVNTGRVPTTVMRDIFTLSSVLRRAVRLGKLTDNPVRRVDKPRIDRRPKIRFLDQPEESRLRAGHSTRATPRYARLAARPTRGAKSVRENCCLPCPTLATT
jgi:site-specific recombinase XerD